MADTVKHAARKTPSQDVTTGETKLSSEYSAAFVDIPSTEPSGGDFHDAFPINDGSGDIAVVMGDVCGHGPEQTAQAERVQTMLADCLDSGLTPAQSLESVNSEIEGDSNSETFTTVFAGRLEPETGKLVYANGGHEPALIAPANAATDQVRELPGTGPLVGAFPSSIVHFEDREDTVPEGGTVLLYTDGISEARPTHNRAELLGIERLKKMFALLTALPLVQLVSKLIKWVNTFCRGEFLDDIAVLAVRRHSPLSDNEPNATDAVPTQ